MSISPVPGNMDNNPFIIFKRTQTSIKTIYVDLKFRSWLKVQFKRNYLSKLLLLSLNKPHDVHYGPHSHHQNGANKCYGQLS